MERRRSRFFSLVTKTHSLPATFIVGLGSSKVNVYPPFTHAPLQQQLRGHITEAMKVFYIDYRFTVSRFTQLWTAARLMYSTKIITKLQTLSSLICNYYMIYNVNSYVYSLV